MKVIGVFGVSGVGKTTLIERVLEQERAWVRISAGSLIEQHLPNVTRDSLRTLTTEQIISNQEAIIRGLAEQRKTTDAPLALFDGHLLVDTGRSSLEVPLDVVRRLELEGMVFVHDVPHHIARRRTSDPKRTCAGRFENEIAEEQVRSRAIAESYASQLRVPIAVLTPAQCLELLATVSRWLRARSGEL
jgi:adenylate kinase